MSKFVKLPEMSDPQMRYSALQTLLIDSSPTENSGLFLQMEESSMNQSHVSITTVAEYVKQFRSANVALISSNSRMGTVRSALDAFFRRMSEPSMVRLFLKLDAVPEDIAYIMIQYWDWLLLYTMPPMNGIEHMAKLMQDRQLKLENSVVNPSNWVFVWTKDKDIYECIPRRKINCGPAMLGTKFQIEETKGKAIPFKYFAGSLTIGRRIVARANHEVIEECAETLYKEFLLRETQAALNLAKIPAEGKIAELKGTWSEKAQDCIDYNGELFFIMDGGNDTHRMTISYVQTLSLRNGTEYSVTLENGTSIRWDEECRIVAPQQYITCDVMCKRCFTIGTVQNLLAFEVRTMGLFCGPCIDHMMGDEGYPIEGLADFL